MLGAAVGASVTVCVSIVTFVDCFSLAFWLAVVEFFAGFVSCLLLLDNPTAVITMAQTSTITAVVTTIIFFLLLLLFVLSFACCGGAD